ncbi:MAG: class I SAM-dependent RNA methyltransferase [Deltaproteobacteria bacterium]|nr:class I SAM-dependent RNA methyltransferase [Deltaproteobacteria bacterium]
MKTPLEISITQLAFGGEGLSELNGKKVFVPYAVPGDVLKIKIIEDKKDYARAELLEVVKASSLRVKVECEYFYKCGGCQWQHIRYADQLRYKHQLLEQALQRIAKIETPRILAPLASPKEWNYRNRIRLQVTKQGRLGFYKPHSHEVLPIRQCLIAEDAINEQIPQVKTSAHEIELSSFPGKNQTFANQKEEHFSQVNSLQNEVLKERVKEYLNLNPKINLLELYAGEGNFSFDLASQVKQVTAVELGEIAVQKAQEKIKKEHRRNIEFIQSSSFRALDQFKKAERVFDRVLLDPPRKGAVECLEVLATLNIPEMIYVSCDPATLARDVKKLIDLGYQHDFSQVLDMFPQTYHIESITHLVKI